MFVVGQYYYVWVQVEDGFGVGCGVQVQVDVQVCQFQLVLMGDVGDLVVLWCFGGGGDLVVELFFFFEQGYVVVMFGCYVGCFYFGWFVVDYYYFVFWFGGFFDDVWYVYVFVGGCGVLDVQYVQVLVLVVDVVVGVDVLFDLVDLVYFDFGDQVWVGDVCVSYVDYVYVVVFEDVCSLVWVFDVLCVQYWYVDYFFDVGCQVQEWFWWEGYVGDDVGQGVVGVVVGVDYVDEVEYVGIVVVFGDLFYVFVGQVVWVEFVVVDVYVDVEVFVDFGVYCFEYFEVEFYVFFEVIVLFVGVFVDLWVLELVDYVLVYGGQFDVVQVVFFGVVGGLCVVVDDLLDFFYFDGFVGGVVYWFVDI